MNTPNVDAGRLERRVGRDQNGDEAVDLNSNCQCKSKLRIDKCSGCGRELFNAPWEHKVVCWNCNTETVLQPLQVPFECQWFSRTENGELHCRRSSA